MGWAGTYPARILISAPLHTWKSSWAAPARASAQGSGTPRKASVNLWLWAKLIQNFVAKAKQANDLVDTDTISRGHRTSTRTVDC
ncbi:hypothetical protein B0F90DRAFT_1815905 [Multifurca ochricompacta]|uniref:Uncharacterized protein n=1 Tax=Multifurca ochricompacta TaxID=376703 RepID=A0AAD4M6U7_9AGAM|nr:hypothetical protein B0F90DRAFT_1815905 [Multifurca ochricompacta]